MSRSWPSAACAKRSVTPAPGGAPKDLVEVTTYYATNRNKVGGPEPVKMYGTNYQGNFHYGRAVVSIPPSHKPGEIETAQLDHADGRGARPQANTSS